MQEERALRLSPDRSKLQVSGALTSANPPKSTFSVPEASELSGCYSCTIGRKQPGNVTRAAPPVCALIRSLRSCDKLYAHHRHNTFPFL